MGTQAPAFREAPPASTPIRDLKLTIEGTPLEPVLAEFRAELERVGLRLLKPRFYLSTEWGVPFGTVAVAIPFYLARPDLTSQYAEHAGYVEGASRTDILRYLRHEMGHVVNYAYELYNDPTWVEQFGSMAQPYREEYRVQPFSRRYVRHLPGGYAQKHPDEDWAETFAVWMTPGVDWRADYADRPVALAKLQFCERTVGALHDRVPVVTAVELDEDVGELNEPLEAYYRRLAVVRGEPMPRLDGDLRALFEEEGAGERRPAGPFIRRLERPLCADVYRWTGHLPERTRALVRHLAGRADELHLTYPESAEPRVAVGLTAMVTTLAMNHIYGGAYVPDIERPQPG